MIDPHDDLLRAVARLNRWATRHADLGLPYALARVLALVDELEPARVTDLAEADDCSQPSMTAQVKRLVGEGLVRRRPDPADARASLVELSPAGRSSLARVRAARTEAIAPALAALDDPARVAAATALLHDLLAAARATAPDPT